MLIPSSNAHYPTLSDQVFVVQPNQFEFVTFQTCESVFVNAATIPLEFCLFDLVRFILHVNLHAVSTSKYYTLCREIALLPPTSTVLNSLGVDKVAASELMNFGLPSNSSNYVLIRSLCLSFVSYCSTDIYLLGAQSLSPKDLRRWDENWWNLVSKGDIYYATACILFDTLFWDPIREWCLKVSLSCMRSICISSISVGIYTIISPHNLAWYSVPCKHLNPRLGSVQAKITIRALGYQENWLFWGFQAPSSA